MNNGFFNPYTPGFQYPQVNPFQQQAQKREVIRVAGRPGVDAFQMGPNESVLLLDETAPIVWLVTTDGAGYKTPTPYSISPYQPEPEIDVKALVARVDRLEGLINAKSDSSGADGKSGSGR